MKKFIIILLIVVLITLSLNIAINAASLEPLPEGPSNLPYMVVYNWKNYGYWCLYTDRPLKVVKIDDSGKYKIGVLEGSYELQIYRKWEDTSWYESNYYSSTTETWTATQILYVNYSIGTAETTFELEEKKSSFFGIDFDYSGFFGDLKIQLGKKQESGTYKIIKEWQYPKGEGHVSIPESEIPQGNKGEYVIYIYEGDTIINQYPYTLNVEEKGPYCEINYPVNGQNYNYYPNVNIKYNDMGKLYIYINGEMYKQIYTKDKEGIEVIDGTNKLFDIGLNTVSVKDSNGQVVATVQYMVMREGPDPNEELPEYEPENWVKEIFNKIMDEYSLFFEYVRGIYGFLPVEIVGLVIIIMMLAVVLWFTGRK